MMKKLAITLAVLVTAGSAQAVISCPDLAPGSITAPADVSLKCQAAIAKAGEKFIAAEVKTLGKCKLKQAPGECPTAKDTTKIDKAVNKAIATISKACADDAAQAGLSSSYANLTDDTVISSCMLSQHNVVAGLLSAWSTGATTEPWPDTGKDRENCVKELSGSATKFFKGAIKNANKCLASQAKAGTEGDLAPVCLGSFSGGSFVAPTEAKTAAKQAKLVSKTEAKIAKKCDAAAADIASIFACPGAQTVEDLQNCIICNGWDAAFKASTQQHGETGFYVEHGDGALQLAVSAGTAGATLLIEPGTYQEEVIVPEGKDGLSIVGCGGASNNRPLIIPPDPEVNGRGFSATNVDGLTFQSLQFFNQDSDGIFTAQSDDVTFRDIVADGNRNTRYAVFPVFSNNILVELCTVVAQDDAPIYVGQSATIVVRFNDVRDGVAGCEIENCSNAQVYGNYFTGNTAGLFVFKDGSLIDRGECHDVHHNLMENNNEPNFGTGTVAGLPTGVGLLVLSTDTTPYSYNISRGNVAGGLVIVDQVLGEFGPPFSEDQSTDDNYIFDNWLTGNGLAPLDDWPLPAGADLVYLVTEGSGNCESGNIFDTEIGIGNFEGFENIGTCVLPPPDPFPGCPFPPVE